MAKIKKAFFCQNCGTQHSQWQGKCNGCKEWNTLSEEILSRKVENEWAIDEKTKVSKPIRMDAINVDAIPKIKTGDDELDRVLGGGLVPGVVVLLGGEPGIGKSTLLLQVALQQRMKVLYVSGEESQQQIKLRATRMGLLEDNCFVLSETETQSIFHQIQKIEPQLLIIDSIQTLHSNHIESGAGSVSQIRTSAAELIQYAKTTNIPVILVGHITKDGAIAGPKILEHMVDTVLQFEGDRNHLYRILRVKKNRFGSTNEIGIYEMVNEGLKEIINPSEILIGNSDQKLSGTAICASVEGSRPFLIEVQALVSTAVYGTPQRSTMGINTKRLNMLLAVLEKRAGFHLASKDIFLNITGGLKVEDTGTDLAIIVAILSSNNNINVPEDYCFAAEVGLSGEVRPVIRVDQRVKEAEKLGFSKIFISKYCDTVIAKKIEVVNLSSIEDLIDKIS